MERERFAYVQGLDDHVRRRIRRRRSLRLVVFVRLGAQAPVVVDRRWPRETANHTNLLHSLTSNVLDYCEPNASTHLLPEAELGRRKARCIAARFLTPPV